MGIWIYGGTVNATGGESGAGIGAGEDGGDLRKAESGGGVNILGGTVTAKGGERGAGIGGGRAENMSGTITIKGDNTVVNAIAGIKGGAGIGASSCGGIFQGGNMGGTITIDCGKNSSINAYGIDKKIVDEHDSDADIIKYLKEFVPDDDYDRYTGSGIGAGFGGNMTGSVTIKGGNVNIWSGTGGAGIGGGLENGATGGEGGDVYIEGGNINIRTYPFGYKSNNEAIGSGENDSKSGSVYFRDSNNGTGKCVRVVCRHILNNTMEVDWTKTAAEGERSKLCHHTAYLEISECPHVDHEGNSGLTYTIIDKKMHMEKCKFCAYDDVVNHTEGTCPCGYEKTAFTVTLRSTAGNAQAKVAQENRFTLMYNKGDVITSNTNPPTYSRVKGWTLEGDTSGTGYEPGSDVTVTSDMTFDLVTEPVLKVETTDVQNGKIASDAEYAKPGDTVQFSVEPDFGYSIGSVSYKYLEGFIEEPEDSGNYIPYYSAPVAITPDPDGQYQLTMPALPEGTGGIIVSAEFTKDPNRVYIPDGIENGTVTSDKETAEENDTVTLTIAPDDGYDLKTLRCKKQDGTEVELTKTDYTHYTFAMPDESVFISAEFDLTARLVGHSLSLNGNIGVNFYMELDDSFADSDTAYMYFTIPGNPVTYQTVYVNEQSDASLSHAEKKAVGDKTYYVFPCSVVAKEMTSNITAQIIDGEDQGKKYTYSVKEYADYLIEHADSDGTDEEKAWAKAVPLVEKMLQYGAYARAYFDDTDLDDIAGVEIPSKFAGFTSSLPDEVTYVGATLSLKSQTTFSLYFNSGVEGLTFTCIEEPVEGQPVKEMTVETVRTETGYIARIRDIAASKLQKNYIVTVKNGETEIGTITYSPMNYAYKVLNGGTTNKRLQNVAKALHQYSQAANLYFGQEG